MKKYSKLILFIILANFLLPTGSYAKYRVMYNSRFYGANINRSKVTVLMYHQLTENDSDISDFSISAEKFENDIIYLIEENYKFLSLQDLRYNNENTGKCAMITFDDGYESNYTIALPIVEKYHIPVLFFIVTDYIGKDGYLSEQQVKELSKNPYVTIGSHTDKIHDLPSAKVQKTFLLKKEMQNIFDDIDTSFKRLESITGKAASSLSYPYGVYSQLADTRLKDIYPGLITFSSNEAKQSFPCNFSTPVGRFNRKSRFVMP